MRRHVLPTRRPADPGQRHPDRARGDPHRDDARLPRLRRSLPAVVGEDARGGAVEQAPSRSTPGGTTCPPGCASWPWCWPSPWSAGPWRRSSTPPDRPADDDDRAAAATVASTGPPVRARPARDLPRRRWRRARGARRRPRCPRRRDRRAGGRVRLRQVDDGDGVLRLLPPGTRTEGQILLEGEDVLSMKPGRLRAVRWTGGGDRLPGRAARPQPRAAGRGADRPRRSGSTATKRDARPAACSSGSGSRRAAARITRTSCPAGRSSG